MPEDNEGKAVPTNDQEQETGITRVTEEATERKSGPGFPPKEHQFTSTNQPAPGKISEGIKRKKFSRDVIRTMLNEPLRVKKDTPLGKMLIEIYGEAAFDMPVGELMTLRQMEKAVQSQDTQAFSAVTDQGMGRPVQAIAQTDVAGNDLPQIQIALPIGITLGLPQNTEGTDKKGDTE